MHAHPVPSVLSGPDPAHVAALHRPTPVDRLLAWPPHRRWTSLYLRTHQAVACLVLLTGVLIALLANG